MEGLQKHIDGLRVVDAELVEQEESLKAQLAEVQDERAKITNALKALGAIKPKRSSGQRQGGYLSDEMYERIVRALPDGEFTKKQLAELAGVSEPSVARAIDRLRKSGELRLIGEHIGGNAAVYRVRDATPAA